MPDDCFILVKLDINRIRLLKLEVNADTIANRLDQFTGIIDNSIIQSNFFPCSICVSKLKVKQSAISILSESVITVRPTPSSKVSMYHSLQQLKEQLPNVVIKVKTHY